MITATPIRDLFEFRGHATLYLLSSPVISRGAWDDEIEDYTTELTEYVIVSAVEAPFSGPETYIFAANAAGEVTCWGEMDGSFKGDLDHARAIRNAGWKLLPKAITA